MNKCACGCGEEVKGTWKRGHIGKTQDGKRKIAGLRSVHNPFVIHEDKKRHSATPRTFRKMREAENSFHCDICLINEWQSQKLSLIVDHIDGQHWNDIIENLRLVCPNCASLLPTHAGRNKKVKSIL